MSELCLMLDQCLAAAGNIPSENHEPYASIDSKRDGMHFSYIGRHEFEPNIERNACI